MDTAAALADLRRRLDNIVRVGTVADVDHATARVRIQIGGLLTDWLPWSTLRAGDTRIWSPPTLGEQVTVLSPSGEPAAAVVIPAIFQTEHPAPSSSAGEHVIEFPDGAILKYDHAASALSVTGIATAMVNASDAITAKAGNTIDAEAGTSATVKAGDSINAEAGTSAIIKAPDITMDGKVAITGLVSMLSGFELGVDGAGGSASADGDIYTPGTIEADTDVIAAGKRGASHTHPDVMKGSDSTGGPQ